MNFCSHCGAPVTERIPDGDDRLRFICDNCNAIHYQNPKLVVGCIPEWEDKILLCRRSIEPKSGEWTLPAGYLENGESLKEGARRETREEACARVEIIAPYALMSISHISQVYILFRAKLLDTDFKPGEESSDVRLFSESEIPWDELAFAVVIETLKRYYEDRSNGSYSVHTGRIYPPSQAFLR